MPRRVLQGTVVSAKADKTIVVLVERRFMHPTYHKTVRDSKKYRAHDEENTCQEGDLVEIIESRRYSKHKAWLLVNKITQAS
jgi:small subunit ribosomal protein S17